MIKKNNDYPPSTHGKALGLKPIDRFRERILKVSLVFLPLYFFNPLSKQLYISPLEYLMVVIFIIFLFSLSYRPKFYFFGHRSIWLFFLSGLLTTISLAAVLITNFNVGWIKAWGGRWIFRYILIFVVVAALSINKKHLNMLIRIITYTNFIVAALAILLVIISKDISAFRKAFSFAPLSLKGFIQATIFFRPNVFARFIVATFPFAFVWMRLRNSKFLTPIIIINAIGIISTVSVMGTLTFFIELIILLFFQKKIAKKSFFICVAILIIIPFLFIGLSWRFERKMSNLLEHGTGVRIVMYRSALEAIQDKPILGCGPGSAKYVINKSGEITEVSEQIWGKSHELTLHNSILSIAAEAGIPAAAFFLIGAISLIISSWKKTKKATSSVLSSIYLAGFLSTLTFFMSGMVFSNLAENIGWYGVAITIFILKAPTEMLQDFYV